MDILNRLKQGRLYCDGGMGTLLQAAGLAPGESPEDWNISHRAKLIEFHRDYLDAGADIIVTNTFGANRLKYHGAYQLEQVIRSGVENARQAIREAGHGFVGLDISSGGRLIAPLGDLPFEQAIEVFSEVVRIGAAGCDLIFIETMNDSYEAKAALLAAKENCDLPVFVTTVYDQRGRSLTGADAGAMITMLEGLGADAVGMNCGLGPAQMKLLVPQLARFATRPLIVNPNAGLPRLEQGQTVFDVNPAMFAQEMREIAAYAPILGGCCGTTPEHIRRLRQETENLPLPVSAEHVPRICSFSRSVELGKKPLLIGERLNPTGKARLKQALREHDLNYILRQGLMQQEQGVQALDVNVGLPEVDEPALLAEVVRELQSVIELPLVMDSPDPKALERAMRLYNGKPLVNSVNGTEQSMSSVFPLVKKYGGVLIALTLDEQGIPATAEERLAIAEKICARAESYGLNRRDLIFDTLVMPVSASPEAAQVTLGALRLIRERLGCLTILGVSNVSFGLPERGVLNASFFTQALATGLSAAIINPAHEAMMTAYYSFCALFGLDEQCAEYIDYIAQHPQNGSAPSAADNGRSSLSGLSHDTAQRNVAKSISATETENGHSSLKNLVKSGLSKAAGEEARRLLAGDTEPLQMVNEQLIPALDEVGIGFEHGVIFLPQLLMAAEAAREAFDAVKDVLCRSGSTATRPGKIIIATVKGDIHDIGKNIVRLLLENYGFDVMDLGKDVLPQKIVDAARNEQAAIVMLSALMTTTVPAMHETIDQLHAAGLPCRIGVGGAVLNAELAAQIGADRYCRDAMESVRWAGKLIPEQ